MKIISKIAVVLLIAVFANSPLYAVCQPEGCTDANCVQLLYDTGFDEPNCHSYWSRSGSTSIVDNVADAYGRLYGSGSISQTVIVPTGYGTHEVFVHLDVVPSAFSNGTEKVNVEIFQASNGAVLETLAVFTPTSSDDTYTYYIDDYGSFNVGLRFRYIPGNNPLGTEFRILHTDWWEAD